MTNRRYGKPAGADEVVERFGIKASDDLAKDSGHDDDHEKEQRHGEHRFAGEKEEMEEGEHHEHMSKVDLITALAEPSQRPQDARTFPTALSSGNDEHAGAKSENGHVESNALQGPVCGLSSETEDENQER